MTRSNSGMKIRTRRGFSTCNTIVKRISYKCFILRTPIVLIGLCTFSLIFKHTFIILNTEWFHSSVPLQHLRFYFPCIAPQFSNIPGNQFHSELVFLSVNWELFSPIFSYLLHFHSPKENVIARKRKKRMKIGEFLNKGLKKELGVANKQRFWLGGSYNKAFHFLS